MKIYLDIEDYVLVSKKLCRHFWGSSSQVTLNWMSVLNFLYNVYYVWSVLLCQHKYLWWQWGGRILIRISCHTLICTQNPLQVCKSLRISCALVVNSYRLVWTCRLTIFFSNCDIQFLSALSNLGESCVRSNMVMHLITWVHSYLNTCCC